LSRLLADAMHAARDDGAPRGTLTIGSLETTAALRLTPLLTRFAADNPAVDLVLRTGTTCELIGQVLEQQVDAAFVCGPVAHPDLEERTMFREELVVLAGPNVASLDAALEAGEVRLVVLRAGCSYRQMLETLLARRGIVVQRQLEFGTLEAIFGCVSAGLGITLLPRALVGGVCDAGRVSAHTLARSDAMVDTVFVRHRQRFMSSALRAFLACASDGIVTAWAA
jgi:DNA-binding transcriptional LysR family regulator